MKVLRFSRCAGAWARNNAWFASGRPTLKPSIKTLALAGVGFACLSVIASIQTSAAEGPVDITYSAPGPVGGGTLSYHVTGTTFGGDHAFAAGLETGSGLILPRGAYPDVLTSLTISLTGWTSGGDILLSYNAMPALGDDVGLGLTYSDAAFYISVADLSAPLTPPNVVSAGVFKRNDAFNNETDYVLATGCEASGSSDVCALAGYVYPGSSTLQFGYQDTPEPASWTLLAAGLIGLGLAIRRRRRLSCP